MEFLVISPTKLKVKLTVDEIRKFSLSDIDSEHVAPAMRRGLWQLIDIAKGRSGFFFGGEKLLIQFYKNDSGGELFVTKLIARSARSERMLDSASNITILREHHIMIRFNDADSVICALSMNRPMPEDIFLYYSDDGSYYLDLTSRSDPFEYSHLLEYGDTVDELLMNSITEHSELIGDAVSLSVFFAK